MRISFRYDRDISAEDWNALVRKLHGPKADPQAEGMSEYINAVLTDAFADHLYRVTFDGRRELANDAIRAAYDAKAVLEDIPLVD